MRDASASDLVFFRAHALTRGFDEEELWRLETKVERVEIETGDTVCVQGASIRGLFFVRSGELRVSQRQRDDTTDVKIVDLEAPTVIGEMELISGADAIATVTAKTPLVTFVLTNEKFAALMVEGDPVTSKMMRNIAQVVVKRLMDANQRYLAVVDPNDFSSLSEALTGCWEHGQD